MQRHLLTSQCVAGLAHYTFDSLGVFSGITHSISTRQGGVSPAPFHTLNLSHSVGDEPTNVATNLKTWHAAIGVDTETVVSARQAHADGVAIVGRQDRGEILSDIDALLTAEPGVPLMLRFADCVPILLYDPVCRVVGVVHAGWRGTVKKIATRAAETMHDHFGTRPRDLVACIGPSIGPCCYGVGDEVIALVQTAFASTKDLLSERNGVTYLDLWQANATQLRAFGVEQIEIARLCTAEHTDDLYSARAEGQRSGRFGALIVLRDKGLNA